MESEAIPFEELKAQTPVMMAGGPPPWAEFNQDDVVDDAVWLVELVGKRAADRAIDRGFATREEATRYAHAVCSFVTIWLAQRHDNRLRES